jgi:hypothetical protein
MAEFVKLLAAFAGLIVVALILSKLLEAVDRGTEDFWDKEE